MTDSIERRLVAVMFTDVVGYTAIMQSDEKAARTVRFRHRRVLEQALGAHGGELLQYLGDGSLTVFSSAVEAVHAAIQVQKDLQEDPAVPLRIGIHVGEISYDTQGVYGDSVNIASRVQSLGKAGSVLISEKAQDEIKNQPGLASTSLGRFDLRNVAHPLGVYAVVAEGLVVPTRGELVGRSRRWLGATAAVLSVAAVVVLWPRDTGGPPPPSGATSGPSSPPDTQEVQQAPVVVRPPTADPLPRVASVVVALPRDTLRVGDRVQLSATAATAGGDPVSSPVDWLASDSSIARVDRSGAQPMLVVLSPGRVSVTATIDDVGGTATAQVIEAVTALNLSPDGGTLALGDTVTIEVTDQDGRPLEASFESSDPAVATVSEAGMLEGQALGQITLHVSADGLTDEAIFTFGTPEPEEIQEEAASDSIAPQEVDQEKAYEVSEITELPQIITTDIELNQLANDNYPPLLRDDNIGGQIILELRIDESGDVVDCGVHEQSEFARESLKVAACNVALMLRFEPAKLSGVSVKVSGFPFRVNFEVRE